jgi:ABC-type phosphate/phosphonate transport system substrate-binding protein
MIASLGMYPFAHLRDDYDRLWTAVGARLGDTPEVLSHDLELHQVWQHHELLVGQTCGWPLVTELPDLVVIGAFDMAVPFAAGGRYRSVIVASKPLGLAHWKADPGTRVVINGFDSLSGWVSLCDVWGGLPTKVLETGAHVESMRAVAEGRAEVASIDAVSFEHFVQTEPMVAARLNVIGHGPRVPSLPLVMAPGHGNRLAEVRAAFAQSVADPALTAVCGRLRIRGFVPFDRSDYLPLLELAHPQLR